MQNVKIWLSRADSLITNPSDALTDMIDESVAKVNAVSTARNYALVGALVALSIIYPYAPLVSLGGANRVVFNVVLCITYAAFARSLIMTLVLWLKTE